MICPENMLCRQVAYIRFNPIEGASFFELNLKD